MCFALVLVSTWYFFSGAEQISVYTPLMVASLPDLKPVLLSYSLSLCLFLIAIMHLETLSSFLGQINHLVFEFVL